MIARLSCRMLLLQDIFLAASRAPVNAGKRRPAHTHRNRQPTTEQTRTTITQGLTPLFGGLKFGSKFVLGLEYGELLIGNGCLDVMMLILKRIVPILLPSCAAGRFLRIGFNWT